MWDAQQFPSKGPLVLFSAHRRASYMSVTGGPSRLSQLRTVKSEWLRKFSDFLFLSSEFSPQIGAHSQALEAPGKGARDLEDR